MNLFFFFFFEVENEYFPNLSKTAQSVFLGGK
jgi:hypothetical protein